MTSPITRLPCARCGAQKALAAYAVFAEKRDRVTGRVLYVERDDTCRRCRGEMYRNVPDAIVKWRSREASLVRQLKTVRAMIRSLGGRDSSRDRKTRSPRTPGAHVPPES